MTGTRHEGLHGVVGRTVTTQRSPKPCVVMDCWWTDELTHGWLGRKQDETRGFWLLLMDPSGALFASRYDECKVVL